MIGEMNDSVNNVVESGSVYVFEKNNEGVWAETQILLPTRYSSDSLFGSTKNISISGNYAIIGATQWEGDQPGLVYIYERNMTLGEWKEKTIIEAQSNGTGFGNSVAISGNYAIVGEDRINTHFGGATDSYAYIIERKGGNWQITTTLTNSVDSAGFGYSVAICGHFAIVGQLDRDNNGPTGVGRVHIYEKSNNSWNQVATFTNNIDGSAFGMSVAISENCAVVGAPRENENKGRIYVYERNSDGLWNLVNSNLQGVETWSSYGESVDIYGNNVLIGAQVQRIRMVQMIVVQDIFMK